MKQWNVSMWNTQIPTENEVDIKKMYLKNNQRWHNRSFVGANITGDPSEGPTIGNNLILTIIPLDGYA